MTIKKDTVMIFRADATNALKATNEIDNVDYTYTSIFESIVLVSFATKDQWEYADYDKSRKEVEKILKKYNIGFKYKKFVY